MRPTETEDIVYQGSRIAVPPSAHGRGGAQTAGMCHRIAVFLATVAAGGSLLWSPLVAPSASTAMRTQRSQAAATSRPLGDRWGGLGDGPAPGRGNVEPADSGPSATRLAALAGSSPAAAAARRCASRYATAVSTIPAMNSATVFRAFHLQGAVSPSNAGARGRSIMDGPSSKRASANGCSARGLLGELSGTVHVGMDRDRWCRDAD
jgi:hypothetical protein